MCSNRHGFIMRNMQLKAFRRAGNAPVMIHKSLLELIVEDWYDISLRMKNDPAANKAFGWILEMVCTPAS